MFGLVIQPHQETVEYYDLENYKFDFGKVLVETIEPVGMAASGHKNLLFPAKRDHLLRLPLERYASSSLLPRRMGFPENGSGPATVRPSAFKKG